MVNAEHIHISSVWCTEKAIKFAYILTVSRDKRQCDSTRLDSNQIQTECQAKSYTIEITIVDCVVEHERPSPSTLTHSLSPSTHERITFPLCFNFRCQCAGTFPAERERQSGPDCCRSAGFSQNLHVHSCVYFYARTSIRWCRECLNYILWMLSHTECESCAKLWSYQMAGMYKWLCIYRRRRRRHRLLL